MRLLLAIPLVFILGGIFWGAGIILRDLIGLNTSSPGFQAAGKSAGNGT